MDKQQKKHYSMMNSVVRRELAYDANLDSLYMLCCRVQNHPLGKGGGLQYEVRHTCNSSVVTSKKKSNEFHHSSPALKAPADKYTQQLLLEDV